jgi:hypothetical protein
VITTDICRVHGNAALQRIIWPAEELEPHFVMHSPELCGNGSRASCKCGAHVQRCDQTFAAANGWAVFGGRWPRTFGGRDFVREVLPLLDHWVLFRERGSGRVAAILSHDYHSVRDFSALGEQIVVDRLPRSWYPRGATTAYLLRPTPRPARPRRITGTEPLLRTAQSDPTHARH